MNKHIMSIFSFFRTSLFQAMLIVFLGLTGVAWANPFQSEIDEEATNLRIHPVGRIAINQESQTGVMGNRTGEELYKSVCSACHDSGVLEAPVLGDKIAWKSRISQGMNVLLSSAINGKLAMPARGGAQATDEEIQRAVVYMANQSGGNF